MKSLKTLKSATVLLLASIFILAVTTETATTVDSEYGCSVCTITDNDKEIKH